MAAFNSKADVNVTLFPAQINALLRGSQGPVYHRMIVVAEAVRQEARRLAGVHQPVPGERRARRPGTLRDSIVKRPVQTPTGIGWIIGSPDPIALLHHEGTPPHVIRPKRAGGRLVFYWPKAGAVVALRSVNHPGTQPNRFLTNALRVVPRVLSVPATI